MAFDISNFKEVGGNRNFVDGGQVYTLHSSTDTLTTMLADSYLDGLSGTLKLRDVIILCGSDFTQVARVATNSGGVVTVTVTMASLVYGAPQMITGPGAIDLTSIVTEVITNGADAFTLEDGVNGQVKIITLVDDNGDATLTPMNKIGYATIVFADAGDTVTLLFHDPLGWAVTGQGGLGTGPLVS